MRFSGALLLRTTEAVGLTNQIVLPAVLLLCDQGVSAASIVWLERQWLLTCAECCAACRVEACTATRASELPLSRTMHNPCLFKVFV